MPSLGVCHEATELEESTGDQVPTGSEEESKSRCDWSNRQAKIVLGTLISIATAVTRVSFTELVQNILEDPTFNAPFSLTYFCHIWPILLFPAYMSVACIAKMPTREIFGECLHVYRSHEEFRRVPFLWKSLLFCVVTSVTLYTYIRSLYKLNAADTTALYAAHHSFVYLLSWIVLFEKFIAMRIFAMIFSITGIVLFAYMDGFGSPAMFGVVMGVASSSGAAVYGVLYKKFIGEVSSAQAAFFISVMGVFSLLLLWPLWLLLYLLNVETLDWGGLPWGLVIPSALLTLVSWCLRECAVQFTYTIFDGLGMVLSIPLCAVADTVWKGREFSGMKIAALVLITIGLLLILLPENWHDVICKHLRSKRRDGEQQAIGNSTTLRGRLSRTSYM